MTGRTILLVGLTSGLLLAYATRVLWDAFIDFLIPERL